MSADGSAPIGPDLDPEDTTTPPRGRRRRVIVADDDPEMLFLLVEALREGGCDVHGLTNGGRLLVELAKSAKVNYSDIDLIVSDIAMPVCSGLQILEALRAARCALPVILLSGFADRAVRAKVERLGATLIEKPVRIADIRRVALEHLR